MEWTNSQKFIIALSSTIIGLSFLILIFKIVKLNKAAAQAKKTESTKIKINGADTNISDIKISEEKKDTK